MVTGGAGGSGSQAPKSVELWRADGSHCNLPSLNILRGYHTQSRLLVCGGSGGGGASTTCEKFSEGSWTTSHTLLNRRYQHVAWSGHPDGVLLVGGSDNYDPNYKSTELVFTSNSSTTASFTLNYEI